MALVVSPLTSMNLHTRHVPCGAGQGHGAQKRKRERPRGTHERGNLEK